MSIRRTLSRSLVLAVLAVALAGCGGSDDDGETTVAATTTTATTTAATTTTAADDDDRDHDDRRDDHDRQPQPTTVAHHRRRREAAGRHRAAVGEARRSRRAGREVGHRRRDPRARLRPARPTSRPAERCASRSSPTRPGASRWSWRTSACSWPRSPSRSACTCSRTASGRSRTCRSRRGSSTGAAPSCSSCRSSLLGFLWRQPLLARHARGAAGTGRAQRVPALDAAARRRPDGVGAVVRARLPTALLGDEDPFKNLAPTWIYVVFWLGAAAALGAVRRRVARAEPVARDRRRLRVGCAGGWAEAGAGRGVPRALRPLARRRARCSRSSRSSSPTRIRRRR